MIKSKGLINKYISKGEEIEYRMEVKSVRNIMQNAERQLGDYMVVEGWLSVENTKVEP